MHWRQLRQWKKPIIMQRHYKAMYESAFVNQFTKSQSWGGNSCKPTASRRPPASQKSLHLNSVIVEIPTTHQPLAFFWILTGHQCHNGHISLVCQPKKQGLAPCNQSHSVSRRTHYLDTEAASTPPEEELHLFAIGAPTTKSSLIK